MAKFGYIFAFIVGVIVFNSCTQQPEFTSHQSENFIIRQPELKKAYGAYLAGRVAHLRKNFNVAADYYMEALNEDPENKELLGRVYVILASKGRISEAAKYAEISLKKGDKNNFTYIIMAVDEMKKAATNRSTKPSAIWTVPSTRNLSFRSCPPGLTPVSTSRTKRLKRLPSSTKNRASAPYTISTPAC